MAITKKDLKDLIKILKNELSEYIIRTRFLKLGKSTSGSCVLLNKSKNEFLIKINNTESNDEQLNCILHEFAHILSWHKEEQDKDHNHEFGKAYAKIYKIFLEKFLKVKEE